MANVSRLLYSSAETVSFLLQIEPGASSKAALLQARTKIRKTLRDAFASSSRDIFGKDIEPRFFTQGSYSYKTLNDPAWPPEQQMDLDDGCYLPMSFVKEARPSQAAAMFFAFVDQVLEDLAIKEGWKFKKKDTCARLVISHDAHIDIPLYAIPDAEFSKLEKSAMSRRAVHADSKRPDRWDALPSDCVLLAHRTEDWKPSDPRKIKTWFLGAVDLYGEKLRRVCRYLKAWRDHHSPDLDGVSSILLMVCAWKAFEEAGRAFVPSREDEALLLVLEKLPGYLNGPVENPTDRNEDINRLSEDDRKLARDKAKLFRDQLRATTNGCNDVDEAVSRMIASLGDRVPDRPDLVEIVATAKVAILSHPRKEVAAPSVGRSKSG